MSIVFDEDLLQEPVHIDDYSVVNDIPRDTTISLLLNIKNTDFLKADINPQFIIISLSYRDLITRKSYFQTIYTKWAGVVAQKPQPLVHVEEREKQKILNYLKFHHLMDIH